MKHIISFLFAIALTSIAGAQTLRQITGQVRDEEGEPIPEVTISADGVKTTAVSAENGRFEITIPFSSRTLTAKHSKYYETTVEIEGRFVVITMVKNPEIAVVEKPAVVNYKGVVKDEEGEPVSGVKIKIDGTEKTAVTGKNGRFSIDGPANATTITASGDFLVTQTVELDGSSFIIINMATDNDAINNQDVIEAKRQRELEDSLRIAERAKQRALKEQEQEKARMVADSIRAARQAEMERELAIQDSIRTAKRAEEARLRAVADSLKAARKDSLRTIRKNAIARNDSLYRNHGFIMSVELSYNKQLAENGEVIYENYGYRSYDDLTPVEFDVLLGYRFSNAIAISVGTGLLYEMVNLAAYGDVFSKVAYGTVTNFSNIDIPAFLNFKWFMSRSKVQPMLSLSGGLYLISKTQMANAGLGFNIRVSRGSNLYVMGTAGFTPWPKFMDHSPLTYDTPVTAGVKLGLAF